MAIDGAGNLYVADGDNARVLEYNTPLVGPNTTANLVIGNSDFQGDDASLSAPFGVAIDSQGNVYITDVNNNRMVEYDAPLAACAGIFPCVAASANRVYGQPDFMQGTPNNGGISAQSLYRPQGVTVGGNSILVADASNNWYSMCP